MYVTSRPRPDNVADNDWPHSSLMSTRTHFAPSSARRVRMTRLIPPAAPVTIATLPVNSAAKNPLLPVLALLARVERIAQTVAEKNDGQSRHHASQAREDRAPRRQRATGCAGWLNMAESVQRMFVVGR